jgi:hypothetical protein
MSDSYGNNTATSEAPEMKLEPFQHRGKLKWRLEYTSAGKRRRHLYASKDKADKALADAKRQQAAIGKAYDILSPREKAQIAAILHEIKEAGYTLSGVWETVKLIPNAPKAGCTLGNALKEVLAAKKEANSRPRHLGNIQWYLGHFVKGRESLDVRSIGLRELDAWFAARKESPRAKKGHISLLSLFFSHCWRKGYISENPVKRLDPVHLDRGTPAILTLRQSIKAMLWARRNKPQALAWLALTLFCGLRPDAEADFIDWNMIDLKHGRITISKSKIRHVPHRIIDLTFCPPALEWLKVAKAIKSPLPVSHGTRRRWIRELKTFLKLKRWPQDVLRHTAASNLLAYHQDAGKVSAFMGNSPGVLLRDYKALIVKEEAAKFFGILPKERHKSGKTVAEIRAERRSEIGRLGGSSKRKPVDLVQCGQA